MPSPNMPTPDTALVYPGQCLVEGTNLSEGRGTTRPFEIVGAPFLDGHALGGGARRDAACRACGFRPLSFRPTFHKFARPVRAAACSCTSTDRGRVPAVPDRRRADRGGAQAGRRRSSAGAREPYEFVADPPAIDLLTGGDARPPGDRARARRSTRSRRRSRRSSASSPSCRPPALIAGVRRVARCGSRCSAAASTRRTSRTSWWRSTCSRPRRSTSCGSCPLRTRVRQAAGAVRGPAGDVRAGGGGAGAARAASATSSARSAARSRTLRTVRRLTRAAPRARVFAGHRQPTCWRGGELVRRRRAGARRCRSSSSGGAAGARATARRGPGRHARRSARPRCGPRWRPGKPVEGLVPRAVLDYIHRKGLYHGAPHELHVRSRGERPRRWREGPAEPTPSVFIMGAGVVGTALAARLVRAGVPVIGLHGRQVELSDAARAISGVVASTGDIPDIISSRTSSIISVRDERVPGGRGAAGAREAPAPEADPAAHVGREPGAHDPGAGAAVRARGRDAAPAGVVRRSARRGRGA